MVNEEFLQRMKTTAFLINTCRGGVVDHPALKEALIKRYIAGAALDVFAEEPPQDQKFISLPNLMITPHIGGNARESVEKMGRAAIQHLISFFDNSLATHPRSTYRGLIEIRYVRQEPSTSPARP